MQEAIPQGAKRKQLCEIEETKKKIYSKTNKQTKRTGNVKDKVSSKKQILNNNNKQRKLLKIKLGNFSFLKIIPKNESCVCLIQEIKMTQIV